VLLIDSYAQSYDQARIRNQLRLRPDCYPIATILTMRAAMQGFKETFRMKVDGT
jgi:hypothetical protein